jgi:uncharacterized CHY-type Zn-finger protein
MSDLVGKVKRRARNYVQENRVTAVQFRCRARYFPLLQNVQCGAEITKHPIQ